MRFTEPNFETACQWWPDLRNIWTPIGWKNHLFRFNVFFNGTIYAQPHLNRRTERWKDQGVQLGFQAAVAPTYRHHAYHTHDDGMVRQGWCDGPAPRLWSEWAQDGVLLRQEIFAHIPGGKDIVDGDEPLFAWVRLSIHETCPALPLEPVHGFLIKINAPHIGTSMLKESNIRFNAERSRYPRKFVPDANGPVPAAGWRLAEADGRIRLGIAPKQKCEVSFIPGEKVKLEYIQSSENDSFLYVQMPAVVGAHVDLLLPMLPMERKAFDRELALGYDAALKEAHAYWTPVPETAARVETPEVFVNEAIKHSLRFAEVIAERNPADGNYSILSGALTYADLWSTPHSMACVMLLDTLGYHDAVDRYLELFRREQGTVVPPGDAFKLHPGYLSSPKTLTSVDWLSDHGALLHTICAHALLSGDERFVARWTDAIVKACEFIQYARGLSGHGGFAGILPPAVATDKMTKIQAVWNDGWNYKGLTAAVRLLKSISHPRAEEFEREARDYRTAFQKAFRAKTAEKPTWKDARGREHPFVPTALFNDAHDETRHAFYLDGGPLFTVYAGLMDAGDELMKATRLWFREGPQVAMHREDSNCWQVPCLRHEMSSCEPCYSWNTFHSHQLGDRERFLEGLYSLFAGSLSRQTYISCETRGGIAGTIFSAPLAIYLARLAVVDDQLQPDELHLLRLTPLAWMQKKETVFENLPTEFGPVTLRFKLSADETKLSVAFKPRFRSAPKRILLHTPPIPGLKEITLNGKPHKTTGKPLLVSL